MKKYIAYWLCPNCGYEWLAAVGNRSRGHGVLDVLGKDVRGQNKFSSYNIKLIKRASFQGYPFFCATAMKQEIILNIAQVF